MRENKCIYFDREEVVKQLKEALLPILQGCLQDYLDGKLEREAFEHWHCPWKWDNEKLANKWCEFCLSIQDEYFKLYPEANDIFMKIISSGGGTERIEDIIWLCNREEL